MTRRPELGLFGVKLTGNALSFEVPAPSFERIVGHLDKWLETAFDEVWRD